MPKKNDKQFSFIINAFVIALMALAVMHTIKPYIEPPDPLKPQIMEYAASASLLKPDAIPALMASASGRPTLLVVYASWCGYCRIKMPEIVSLMREGKFAHVEVVFLSIDKSPVKLAEYLVHAGFYQDIVPYIVTNGYFHSLSDTLRNIGSAYRGSIPFMEIYDAKGRAVRSIPHNASLEAFIAATRLP